MLDYLEFSLLIGLLTVAGILMMSNLEVERWCERWLERASLEPRQNL